MFGTRIKKRWIAAVLSILVIPGLILAAYASFRDPSSLPQLPPPIDRDLDVIVQRDTIIALTTYNSTSYFLYRGQPLGYEYDLLKDFAEETDVVLRMRVVPKDSLLFMLNRGDGDIAASRIVPTEADTANFAYTTELYHTRPVVVQREGRPQNALSSVAEDDIESPDSFTSDTVKVNVKPVVSPADLAGTRVYLSDGSPYTDRLVELEDRITGDIEVVEVDTSSETIIRQVARGRIPLTVAQENVAQLEETLYTNLAVAPAVGPLHPVTWAVRKNAPSLQTALNAWIAENRDDARWDQLYEKYFVDRYAYRERAESRYLTGETGTLSNWDALLKKYASEAGIDWRLLAAQTFQESRFDPRARSWAGAMGLLQLMPGTASDLGVSDPYDPDQNVRGAVKYLLWLEKHYWAEKIEDPAERLKFVLASYNTGAGHVMDAQRLTEKNGGDPTNWEEVAFWLLRKSQARYYNDPVVRHGYARGLEPVEYVARILDRFEHYRQFVPNVDAPPAPSVPS